MKFSFTIFFIILSVYTKAQNLGFGFGSTYNDKATCSVVDAAGNFYIAGYYGAPFDIDPGPGVLTLPNAYYNSSFPCYIAKFNTSGQLLWAKNTTAGPNSYLQMPDLMAFTPSGNLIMIGTFKGPNDFDPGPGSVILTPSGSAASVFVWELDSSGNFVSAYEFMSTLNNNGQLRNFHWLHDSQNNTILTGDFFHDVVINPGTANADTISASGVEDAFVIKFDSQFNVLFKGSFGNIYSDNIQGIASDTLGNILLSGDYTGTVDFEMGPALNLHTSSNSGNSPGGFLIKLNPQMQTIWVKTINSINGFTIFFDAYINHLGQIVCMGESTSSATDFDPGSGTQFYSPINTCNFIEILDSAGNYDTTIFYNNTNITAFTADKMVFKELPGGQIILVARYLWDSDMDPGPGINLVNNYDRDIIVALLDENFAPIKIQHYSSTVSSFISSADFSRPGEILITGDYTGTLNLGTPAAPNNFPSPGNSNSYWVKINIAYNSARGHVFYDMNNNNLLDTADCISQGHVFQIGNSPAIPSVNPLTAEYSIYTDTGNFVMSLSNINPYYTSVPAQHQLSFGNLSNQSDTANDFRLVPIPNMTDAEISLTALSEPIIGNPFRYQIDYRNVGTDTLSGQLQMAVDPIFVIDNTSVPVFSQSGNTLTWNYMGLKPLEHRTIIINAHLPVSAQLGDTTITSATMDTGVLTELTPVDNSDTSIQIISGPFDPNFKETQQPNALDQSYATSAGWLDYIIHFQNEGTSAAINVVIKDTLDRNMLDAYTIQLTGSSHAVQLTMDSAGIMTFLFPNINLTYSLQNYIASQGFVRFRIKTTTGLNATDTVRNKASIYFDFNSPVETNVAKNFLAPVANMIYEFSVPDLFYYPNPTSGIIYLPNIEPDSRIIIYNPCGEIVLSGQGTTLFDISCLPDGVYLMLIQSKGETFPSKIIKQ